MACVALTPIKAIFELLSLLVHACQHHDLQVPIAQSKTCMLNHACRALRLVLVLAEQRIAAARQQHEALQQRLSQPDTSRDAQTFAEVTEEEDTALMGSSLRLQMPQNDLSRVPKPAAACVSAAETQADSQHSPASRISGMGSHLEECGPNVEGLISAALPAAHATDFCHPKYPAADISGASRAADVSPEAATFSNDSFETGARLPQISSDPSNAASAESGSDESLPRPPGTVHHGPDQQNAQNAADHDDEAMWAAWEQAEAEAEAAGELKVNTPPYDPTLGSTLRTSPSSR